MLNTIFQIVLVVLALKSMIIGSEFSFHYMLKHGRKYWDWYNKRETYAQYLSKNP